MKSDPSIILFEKYYASSRQLVKVTMVNAAVYIGSFVGFSKGDNKQGESCVLRWHMLVDNEKGSCNCGDYYLENGFWIDQSHILSVELLESSEIIYKK